MRDAPTVVGNIVDGGTSTEGAEVVVENGGFDEGRKLRGSRSSCRVSGRILSQPETGEKQEKFRSLSEGSLNSLWVCGGGGNE